MNERRDRSLIAFDDLNKIVISRGFCTYCGACEAACPVHAIRIRDHEVHYDDCSHFLDFCPICYDICPHTEPLLIEALKFVSGAPKMREALGYYRKVFFAQSSNPKLREVSHGGGVVTTLLIEGLKSGLIDSAVISEAEPYSPLKLVPQISLVPDDVLSAVDSKFTPSSVAKAFGSAVRDYGKAKIAFVGVPHQVLAIRKLEAWEHKIMSSLQVTIGLFCLWIFSLDNLIEYLSARLNVDPHEIVKIDLAETYKVYTNGKVFEVPISEVMPYIMNKCRTCMDFTSELADISVGGAGPLQGWSAVIIRTRKGEEFFRNAVEAGSLRTMEIDMAKEAFTHVISMSLRKKRIARMEIRRLRNKGMYVPPSDVKLALPLHEVSVLSEVKVKDIMTKDVITVKPRMTVSQLLDTMIKHHHMGYPVTDEEGNLIGMVTFEDLMRIPKREREKIVIEQIAKKELVVTYPNESVLEALEKMESYDIGRLPVVDPETPKRIVGVITRSDVLHALSRYI
ncbi:CBS domain-containing protein [Candidatus Bathyarchaeota archaeon]|nr:MAG: CBS domain-containing protein [Candidatus Bathyarchaeota archaeon]